MKLESEFFSITFAFSVCLLNKLDSTVYNNTMYHHCSSSSYQINLLYFFIRILCSKTLFLHITPIHICTSHIISKPNKSSINLYTPYYRIIQASGKSAEDSIISLSAKHKERSDGPVWIVWIKSLPKQT